MTQFYILLVSFFFIALIYSSVGFGGGSSYLALMAVIGIAMEVMRPAALLCNIVVVTGGAIIYYRQDQIDFRKSWPFLVSSVPMAFVGGFWRIRQDFFFGLLGITLVAAAVALWIQRSSESEGRSQKAVSVLLALGIGGAIGLLSGLVSIGGGIFLAPLLHLMRWDNGRKIAALSSLFILVNSISGLIGNLAQSATPDWHFVLPLLAVVFAGGQVGSRLGATKFDLVHIKRITAVLILFAGINILKDHL